MCAVQHPRMRRESLGRCEALFLSMRIPFFFFTVCSIKVCRRARGSTLCSGCRLFYSCRVAANMAAKVIRGRHDMGITGAKAGRCMRQAEVLSMPEGSAEAVGRGGLRPRGKSP